MDRGVVTNEDQLSVGEACEHCREEPLKRLRREVGRLLDRHRDEQDAQGAKQRTLA